MNKTLETVADKIVHCLASWGICGPRASSDIVYSDENDDGNLIIDISPNIDVWFSFQPFQFLPTIEFKKAERLQEDVDFCWLWFWLGYTRRFYVGHSKR